MKERSYIAGEIERNRIALLRMVFCWLSAALFLNVRGDRPLPRRLAAWVEELVSKAEKATVHLLIATFYNAQINNRRSPLFEKAAHKLIVSNRTITLGVPTICGIIKRPKVLQTILHHLQVIARCLSRSIKAKTRVLAMNIQTMSVAKTLFLEADCHNQKIADLVPP